MHKLWSQFHVCNMPYNSLLMILQYGGHALCNGESHVCLHLGLTDYWFSFSPSFLPSTCTHMLTHLITIFVSEFYFVSEIQFMGFLQCINFHYMSANFPEFIHFSQVHKHLFSYCKQHFYWDKPESFVGKVPGYIRRYTCMKYE